MESCWVIKFRHGVYELEMARHIGTQRESTLHASLKDWYRLPGDLLEAEVDGFVVDIVRGPELVEIQTGNFSNIKRKLIRLLESHPIHLVYPISVLRWILRVDKETGEVITRRKSPKRGDALDMFNELVYIAGLINHPNLSLEIVFVEDEMVYVNDGLGSWRRKGWSILDRRLIRVVKHTNFSELSEFSALLPENLPAQFTVRQLAAFSRQRIRLAQKIVYSYCQMGILERSGKQGRSWLYRYKHV